MKRAVQIIGLVVIAAFFLGACATLKGTKAFTDMSPKEKVTYFMATYNKIYDNTMKMATNPNATDLQKQMVKYKKELLTKVWPMIKAYDFYVSQGMPIDPKAEQEILDMLDKLATEI